MSAFNPYAPPRDVAPPPVAAAAPLPQGIRRYGLDAAKLRALLDRAWRAGLLRVALTVAIVLALQFLVGGAPIDFLLFVVPFFVPYLVIVALVRRWRVRRSETKVLQGYELLVSPRAMW